MKTIKYKMADGTIIDVEVTDKTAEMIAEEKRYFWKIRKREQRYESIASIEQREENGEQVTVDVESSPFEKMMADEEEREKQRLISLLPQAISMLTPEQQALLQKVVYEGKTHQYIADEAGVDRVAVTRRMTRIYCRLKNILKKL